MGEYVLYWSRKDGYLQLKQEGAKQLSLLSMVDSEFGLRAKKIACQEGRSILLRRPLSPPKDEIIPGQAGSGLHVHILIGRIS